MAREDPFIVRHASWPAVGESGAERAVMNRLGSLIVTDFVDQLVLAGRAYHMQIGTETAPVNSTAAVDDQLVWMLVDNNAGYAMIPLAYEVAPEFVDTGVYGEAYLELDKDKKRYSSGGTAYTASNLRGDDPFSHNGVSYVGTDITALAKSAVPNTLELSRRLVNEDVVTDPTTGKFMRDTTVYSIRSRPMAVGVDVSSLCCHFGATTADLNGFGLVQWAQVEKALITP